MPTIYPVDVTNRDGVQTSRLSLSKLQKTMLNVYLNMVGFFRSEFGFPTTNHEFYYLNTNLELDILSPMILSGWLRATKGDVEIAKKNVPNLKHINLSISTSDQMIEKKFQGKYKRGDITNMMVDALKFAKENGYESVGINAEDASRTDIEFLIEFALAAKENKADTFRYCDTIGHDTDMDLVRKRFENLTEKIKMPIETHFHNDAGISSANTAIATNAILNFGQDAHVNLTVSGLGERAGNVDYLSYFLTLLMGSNAEKNYKFVRELDLTQSSKLTRYAAHSFNVPIPPHQVGVGANAFAHESGIHADGALKDRRNYELYDHDLLGIPSEVSKKTGRLITLGEYSGIKGFRHVCDYHGIEFTDEKSAQNYLELSRFANVQGQRELTPDELIFIIMYPIQSAKLLNMTPFYKKDLNELDKLYRDIFENSSKPIFADRLKDYFAPKDQKPKQP